MVGAFYLGRGSADLIHEIPVLPAPAKDYARIQSDETHSAIPVVYHAYGSYLPREGNRVQELVPVVESRNEQWAFLQERLSIRRTCTP